MPYSNDVKPVMLPPGRARLSTKPAPTGSTTPTNTIGTVRVACCNAAHGRAASGHNDIRRERDELADVSAHKVDVAGAPRTEVEPDGALGPAQLRKRLPQRHMARPVVRIALGHAGDHADAPDLTGPAARAPQAATRLPRRRAG